MNHQLLQLFSVCVNGTVEMSQSVHGCFTVDVCFSVGALSDGLDLSTIHFQGLGDFQDVVTEEFKELQNKNPGMVLISLSWCLGAAFALFCGSSWPQAHSVLAPENEVPLRPTTWLPEGKITTITLPKGRTRR